MPQYHLDDTIAAVATPIGEGSISVIRVSGKDSWNLVDKIFRTAKIKSIQKLETHTIHYGEIVDDQENTLDKVLISLFRNPNSYTGEDVIEISSHGGMANTNRIFQLLLKKGARHAEPGEFTKRAFLNGKIDLTQAEAVMDLIQAKSQSALNLAVRQLSGSLSVKFKQLKDDLMKLYAHLEGAIDFPEEDLEIYSDKEILKKLEKITEEVNALIQSFSRAAHIREGIRAVIVGRPNVGKSSLFNALLERERALVSSIPGTTRDHLEEPIEIAGVMIRLTDTAGIGLKPRDSLDQMGIERTQALMESAQLFLFLVDGSEPLGDADCEIYNTIRGNPVIPIMTKSDLNQKIDLKSFQKLVDGQECLKISAKTEKGIQELETKLKQLMDAQGLEVEGEQITRLRHKNDLETVSSALGRCKEAFQKQESLEFVIMELKSAIDALRELIGEVYSEDLLDIIFSEFCIGK